MPPKGLDCCGYMACVRHADGTWHPVDLSQTVEIVQPYVSEEVYHFTDLSDWTFEVQTELKITRGMLKLIYTGRELRRQIRRTEKQRRKRLKEVHT